MVQNLTPQNQNEGFFQKNQNYIIAGIIVVLLVIYFATQRPKPENTETTNEQTTEQTADTSGETETKENEGETASGEQTTKQAEQKPTEENKTASSSKTAEEQKAASQSNTSQASSQTGDINVSGMLKASNNLSKGNFMLESSSGTYYVSTKRDYSKLVEKEVTLEAEGDVNNFKFLGFKEGKSANNAVAVAPAPAPTTPAAPENDGKGGVTDAEGMISFSGKLEKSDNAAKGNYYIMSEKGKVYVKTSKDYSGWLGKEVNGSAKGTINSFSGLVVTQK